MCNRLIADPRGLSWANLEEERRAGAPDRGDSKRGAQPTPDMALQVE
jgi:hypothetical protein